MPIASVMFLPKFKERPFKEIAEPLSGPRYMQTVTPLNKYISAVKHNHGSWN